MHYSNATECPMCGGKTTVTDIRYRDKVAKRKRRCLECQYAFFTIELLEEEIEIVNI